MYPNCSMGPDSSTESGMLPVLLPLVKGPCPGWVGVSLVPSAGPNSYRNQAPNRQTPPSGGLFGGEETIGT